MSPVTLNCFCCECTGHDVVSVKSPHNMTNPFAVPLGAVKYATHNSSVTEAIIVKATKMVIVLLQCF